MMISSCKTNLCALCFITGIFNYSCKEEIKREVINENHIGSIVDIDFNSNKIDTFSLLFKDINFISLNSQNESAFYDRYDEFIVTSEYIIIHEVDYSNDDNILIFLKDGTFVKKIMGSNHRGPGSFNTSSDILFDPEKNTIEILDRLYKKIVVYNLETQNFHEIQINLEDVDGFVKTTRNYFIHLNSKSHPSNIYILDHQGRPISNIFNAEEIQSLIHGKPTIFYYDRSVKEIVYQPTFSDTLYRLNDNGEIKIKLRYNNVEGLGTEYIVQLMKKFYKSKKFHKASQVPFLLLRDSIFLNFGQLKISPHLNITNYILRNRFCWIIQNTQDISEYETVLIESDEIKDFYKFLLSPRCSHENHVYYLINSDNLLDNYNYLKKNEPERLNELNRRHPSIYRKYMNCISQLDDNSNSILISAELNVNKLIKK